MILKTGKAIEINLPNNVVFVEEMKNYLIKKNNLTLSQFSEQFVFNETNQKYYQINCDKLISDDGNIDKSNIFILLSLGKISQNNVFRYFLKFNEKDISFGAAFNYAIYLNQNKKKLMKLEDLAQEKLNNIFLGIF